MRNVKWFGLLVVAVLSAPHVLADVKTREKTTMKFEGFMGGIINRMFGGADGLTSTVAVKGNRMSTINDTNGQIVDLSEEKIYMLDVKKKEYKTVTFAEMRKQMEEAKKALQQQSQSMNPEEKQAMQDAGKQLEFDADVKETGERKNIAGQDARQAILTIVMREKGKTLEEGGGLVMTNDMWLAERVPAMDELDAFYMKYFKAVFEGTFTGMDAAQANAASAFLPGFAALSERMATESKKLQGTSVMSTMTIEGVKSAEQMKAAASQQQQSGGGGGIGGAIAGRLMRGRGGPPQQRTKAFTSTHELISVATTVSDAELGIPAGFKEKK
ncbi:MAG TPA: hypothetical protein VES67_15745 [Vicinamibacterales bacterium]|nr:hypothetical protein [Vicinamibacterales bacterium]